VAIEELALFHPVGSFGQPGNPFGKDIANAGLFRALARHGGYRQVTVMNQRHLAPRELAAGLFPDGQLRAAVATAPLYSTDVPARGGVLLRGQPYLSELSWLRRSAGRQRDYSLCGLIHTIAPPAIREMIGASALAPTEPWDALICTSPSVQQAMEEMFDRWAEYLRERVGATSAPRPALPLIPLAVDVEAIAAVAADRQRGLALRLAHGIGPEEPVVLWVGRLSFFEKAFPQPMFLAVEQAARQSGSRAHLLMAGWFPGGEKDRDRYLQAAAAYAPSVNLVLLDGNDPDVMASCWSAADVFLSLVDNIQETFGLTPVEAMAAGLPVVVSDWDGYRYTVGDGDQGFLIPTLGGAADAVGTLLATLHGLQLESYQTYVGAVAQHTAVHVAAAARALSRLFDSVDLRRRMGDSGRRRARELFSWPVVVAQYNALFEQLAERRLAAARRSGTEPKRGLDPLRGNPFADFEGFATSALRPQTTFRLADGLDLGAAQSRLASVSLDGMFPGIRANPQEVAQLLASLQATPAQSVRQLQQRFPPQRSEFIALALVWLAKLGLLDWDGPWPDAPPPAAPDPEAADPPTRRPAAGA
jgi:glycosyltransferase involved in cell wall biosynthesis